MNEQIQKAAEKILAAINGAGTNAYQEDPNKYVNALVSLKKLDILTSFGKNIADFGKNVEEQLPLVIKALQDQLR
jgi:hypothetical protein